VCADSYFDSFDAAIHLRDRGLRFIGVVKTATRKYPIQLMKAKTIAKRGEWMSFTHDNLPGSQRVKRINIRSATAGEPPSIEIAARGQELASHVAFASFQDDHDGANRQLPQPAYSSTLPAPRPAPDPPLENLMSWNTHGV
jgi:hypothetical protein